MKIDAIAIKSQDNVATAIRDIKAGEKIKVGVLEDQLLISVSGDIPFGHKLALCPVAKGGDILKYAAVIGRATENIEIGSHVHVHNVESLRGRGDLDQTSGRSCGK